MNVKRVGNSTQPVVGGGGDDTQTMAVNRTDILKTIADLSPEARVKALRKALAEVEAENARHRYRTPGELAVALDPKTVQTPALEAIDEAVKDAVDTGGRLIITVPPQEGKSTRVGVWLPVWALMRDPDTRVVVASYAESLAARNAYQARAIVAEHGSGAVDEVTGAALPDSLGFTVARDNRQKRSWGVQGASGGVYATGTGGGLTGRAADLLIIDDPLKNQQQADSDRERQKVWEWWTTVAQTRLAPGAAVVIIMCMTGDTPVLMGDGSERPLRDIRPGDVVATYEGGRLTTSTVRNWRNNGSDSIYRIKMKSGTEVRANARHPFLTIKDGSETWTRLRDLKPGDSIRRVIGVSGEGSHVPSMGATSPRSVRECVCRTTARSDGQRGTAHRPTTHGLGGLPALRTGMGSPSPSTSVWLRSRAEGVLFVETSRTRVIPGHTGLESSVSTTTTTPGESGDCSVMTATSQSATASRRALSEELLTTYNVTADEVLSIEPCGMEDVFDVQIDRTENFIANGLVSHNTRWHPDDLVGGILAEEAELPAGDRVWRVLNIPAIAEEGVPDALGREPGVVLQSARGRTKGEFERIRRAVGARAWAALYQGQPEPSEGGLFVRDEFEAGRVASADLVGRVVSIDPAESGTGDEAGLLLMGWDADGVVYVEEDLSRPMASATWAREAIRLAVRAEAAAVVYEAFTAERTYRDVLESAWREIAYQAKLLRECGEDTVAAAERWHMEGQPGDTLTPMQRTLEILDVMPGSDHMPFRLVPWRKRGDKVARAAGARQSVTIGRLRMIGHHAVLERQACFVAGTAVSTPGGSVPIEQVRPGDVVNTVVGPREVTHAWCNGVKPTVRVQFEGGSVECTADHLFWSPSVGRWVEARNLMAAGTIEVWHDHTHDTHSSLTDVPTAEGATGTTSAAAVREGWVQNVATSCTGKSGSTTTALSPRGTRFTTATTIGATTTSTTLLASPRKSTPRNTPNVDGAHGTPNGVPSSAAKSGRSGNPGSLHATTAVSSSCPPESGRNTVMPNVGSSTGASAIGSWNAAGTTPRSAGRSTNVLSVQPTGNNEPVYDLTVDDAHEFYANGARVHNCSWQPGQGSPDRVDAMVNGHDFILGEMGRPAEISFPGDW